MSTELNTSHWQYLYGKPAARGELKVQPEDFRVTEQLGYAPCGEGEHIYLWVEKTGLNTAFVAEQLAKYAQLPLRAVSYAGRKDKHAVTRQWFGLHKPGKQDIDWQGFALDGLTILDSQRHNKKLRTGVLKGNRFDITVRGLTETDSVAKRLEQVKLGGVPNYFGPQRFGDSRHHPQGSNLHLAQSMMQGETIRNRNKRSMAISALRAWLFNEFVHQRLAQQRFNQAQNGDVMLLSGSNSFFVADAIDDTLTARLAQRDISLSAPLWGAGKLDSTALAEQFEQSVAAQWPAVCNTLQDLGLKQERRSIRLYPSDMQWTIQNQNLSVSFALPSGTFATTVLREVLDISGVEESS